MMLAGRRSRAESRTRPPKWCLTTGKGVPSGNRRVSPRWPEIACRSSERQKVGPGEHFPATPGTGRTGRGHLGGPFVHARDVTGTCPHVCFEWTEGNPFADFFRLFLFGRGEIAPVTREVWR